MATEGHEPGTGVSVRTLGVLVMVLLVTSLVAVVIGLVLLRQPPLDPVPLPSVSQI